MGGTGLKNGLSWLEYTAAPEPRWKGRGGISSAVLLNFKFFARRDDFKQLGCAAGRSLIREKPYGPPMNADKRG
jgi:hypothetical protein